MDRSRLLSWGGTGLAVSGTLAGLIVANLMLTNDVRPSETADVVLFPIVGCAFLASGLSAWSIRSDNRIGPAMIATGLLWLVSGLFWSQDPLAFAVGHAFNTAYLAGIIFILVAFPTGRLESRLARALAVTGALAAGPAEWLFLALGGHAVSPTCVGCPPFMYEVVSAPNAARLVQVLQFAIGIGVSVLSVGVLAQRWRVASPPVRAAIAPVIWTGIVTLPFVAAWVVNEALRRPLGQLPEVARNIALVAVAISFLVGVARTRLARSGVADLILELGRPLDAEGLRVALAKALRDPSLDVAYWLPEARRYVAADGSPILPPAPGGSRMAIDIEHDGQRIAALICDSGVDDAHLVRSVAAAAALSLANQRLQARLRAQLAEVQASRARIVEAEQEERRRLERDLHDGPQQQLVAVGMTLGLAAATPDVEVGTSRALISEARAEVSAAIESLRGISHGLHPTLLADRGLRPAIEDLVSRSRLPVDLDIALERRLAARVEAAAYYLIAEALTNATKHARAGRVTIGLLERGGFLVVTVADDGVGGADLARGSGLQGLRDRVEALGGSLRVTSPAGQGTTIDAEIPCGSS